MIDTSAARAAEERDRLLRRIATLRERRTEGVGSAGSAAGSAGAGERSVAGERAASVLVDLRTRRAEHHARSLAAAVTGELVEEGGSRYVRIERSPVHLPVDREALAWLPGHPPPHVPLVCLDTETTGLGTAAGTVAFLIGLGWWEADAFRQVQLLLPDNADEPALLRALRGTLPPDAWLVTYNGRGFDWPVLVTRYRLGRDAPPALPGHLDLLPIVRALFRHRLGDARLLTVEADLLGLGRVGDVEGWEIPARYLRFLRDGDAGGLVEVVRHNHEDVRTLARLLAHLGSGIAATDRRADAHPGDLAGLARLLERAGRVEEALDCLDLAEARRGGHGGEAHVESVRVAEEPWWSPRVRADIGGPSEPWSTWAARVPSAASFDERIGRQRARLLRRVGRIDEAIAAWRDLGGRGGRVGALAWIEVAKLEEHVRHDVDAALRAVDRADALAVRLRVTGLPLRGLEGDLGRRRARLARRLARRGHVPVPRRRGPTAGDRPAVVSAR